MEETSVQGCRKGLFGDQIVQVCTFQSHLPIFSGFPDFSLKWLHKWALLNLVIRFEENGDNGLDSFHTYVVELHFEGICDIIDDVFSGYFQDEFFEIVGDFSSGGKIGDSSEISENFVLMSVEFNSHFTGFVSELDVLVNGVNSLRWGNRNRRLVFSFASNGPIALTLERPDIGGRQLAVVLNEDGQMQWVLVKVTQYHVLPQRKSEILNHLRFFGTESPYLFFRIKSKTLVQTQVFIILPYFSTLNRFYGFTATSLFESFFFCDNFSNGDSVSNLGDVVLHVSDEESSELVKFDVFTSERLSFGIDDVDDSYPNRETEGFFELVGALG